MSPATHTPAAAPASLLSQRLPTVVRRDSGGVRAFTPAIVVLANAVAFYLLRPGVPDLWAARARASAAGHGVGLTYWFSWFGGSTPGNYSVITPSLCGLVGTELVASLAAVAVAVLVPALVRGTRRPATASWFAAFGVVVNLWCGRVPFLVGAAFGVAALLCVRRRRMLPALALTVISVLASPVAGAFLALGLSGVLLTARARDYRASALLSVVGAGATLLVLAAVFGAPGPEPFPLYLVAEIVLVLGLMLLTAPSSQLRITLAVALAAVIAVSAFPNGMGSNLVRLALFCLPPAVVAVSRRGPKVLAALMVPVLVLAAVSSASAVVSAMRPGSTAEYYSPLIHELDALGTSNHRLEVVDAGHAAYAVLLGHAALARGWETQEDLSRNAVLEATSLDAAGYRRWLDENAVGYVALNGPSLPTPEAAVVAAGPGYLHEVWRSAHWRLFRVQRATPIVARPGVLEASTQAAMTVRVPCACTTSVRVRWSKFLDVSTSLPVGTPDSVEDTYRPSLGQDHDGWTTLTTNRAGTYVLA